MDEIIVAVNLDAGELSYFSTELATLKAKTYDKLYPALTATKFIPVSTELDNATEVVGYRQFDSTGVMKIIANYADDLPRADVSGKEFFAPIRSLGNSYGYNLQEIRAAKKFNRPLPAMKAAAVRQAYETEVNRIGWFARASNPEDFGLQGLVYNPNITKGNTPSGKRWILDNATPDEIVKDINYAIRVPSKLTNNVEVVDTVILPMEEFTMISTTPRSTGLDTTILEFVKKAHPTVSFFGAGELEAVSPKPSTPNVPSSTTSILIAYTRSIDKLSYEIPQIFEQLPVQEVGLEYIVNCHARVGGVLIYYPLSIFIMENVG